MFLRWEFATFLTSPDERFVDVRNDTSSSDGGSNYVVELLISSDSQLKMAGGYSLHLQILAGVASKLENLSSEILEDSGTVNSRSCADSGLATHIALHQTMNSAYGELDKLF